ncbi:hypothetical protein F4804DRAFT_351403 [Jackrogersella minutella]|nr:hypothetical protein F4804DRAFT_351403 [Jackrogersella minutella]
MARDADPLDLLFGFFDQLQDWQWKVPTPKSNATGEDFSQMNSLNPMNNFIEAHNYPDQYSNPLDDSAKAQHSRWQQPTPPLEPPSLEPPSLEPPSLEPPSLEPPTNRGTRCAQTEDTGMEKSHVHREKRRRSQSGSSSSLSLVSTEIGVEGNHRTITLHKNRIAANKLQVPREEGKGNSEPRGKDFESCS